MNAKSLRIKRIEMLTFPEGWLNPVKNCTDCDVDVFVADLSGSDLYGFEITGTNIWGLPYCFDCALDQLE